MYLDYKKISRILLMLFLVEKNLGWKDLSSTFLPLSSPPLIALQFAQSRLEIGFLLPHFFVPVKVGIDRSANGRSIKKVWESLSSLGKKGSLFFILALLGQNQFYSIQRRERQQRRSGRKVKKDGLKSVSLNYFLAPWNYVPVFNGIGFRSCFF